MFALFVLDVFIFVFERFWFGVLLGLGGGGGGSKGAFLGGGAIGVKILLIIRVDWVWGFAYFDIFSYFFFN